MKTTSLVQILHLFWWKRKKMCLVSKEELVLLDWLSVGTWFSNRKCTQYAFFYIQHHAISPNFAMFFSESIKLIFIYKHQLINSLPFPPKCEWCTAMFQLVLESHLYISRLIIASPTHPMWLCSSSTTKSLLMEWNTLNQDLYIWIAIMVSCIWYDN